MASLPSYNGDIKEPNMGSPQSTKLTERTEERPTAKARGVVTKFIYGMLFVYLIVRPILSLSMPTNLHLPYRKPCHNQKQLAPNMAHTLVPFEAHIMSKCPDAQVG
jgi:hypothetical protein